MAWPRRVPYEWILGAMFVGTFALEQTDPDTHSWTWRCIWLMSVLPLACRALGARRERDAPPPRLGALLIAAVIGWLYAGAFYAALALNPWETRDTVVNFLRSIWPIPIGLSLTGLVLAAVRPGRYREVGVFANAAFLLFVAWMVEVRGTA